MTLKTITFRLPEEKLQALDSVAEQQQRDRSFVIKEALTQYLSLYDYHRALIEEGIRQDDAGEVVDHETLLNMGSRLDRLRKKSTEVPKGRLNLAQDVVRRTQSWVRLKT